MLALGRQAGISVNVPDTGLWARRVPAINGNLSAREALERLARAANATVRSAGRAFVLVPARQRERLRQPRPKPVFTAPLAQATDDEVPADIVVTASKRDTPIDRFAGQVERVDGNKLTFGGVGGTDKLVARIASVSSTHLGSGRNKLFIRGIADSSFTGPTQSTVGQYFGDLRLSYNAPDPDLRLSDLRSVEVLEGPQGALYGAGSLGGIIRLVPNPPLLREASAAVTVGGSLTQHGDPGGDASATLNLPLGEIAALRIVADTSVEGGYIDKPLLERTNVNRTDLAGGRATLRVSLGDNWNVDLTGLGQRTRGADSQYADRDGTPLTRLAGVSEGFDADYWHGQMVASGAVGTVRVSSSTGFASHELSERYDATPAGQSSRLFVQRNDTRLFAHETRIWRPSADGSGWLVGASYTNNRTDLTRRLGEPGMPAAVTGVKNRVDEVSAFGEAGLQLLPGLTGTGGLRYTRSRLSGEAQDIAVALTADLAAQRAGVTAARTEATWLPSASLVASLFGRTQLYGRYQQGFRPGGLAVEADFVRRFRSDKASTFEVGLRDGYGAASDHQLSLNVAYTKWRDVQADFIDATGLPSTANIGDAEIWSVSATGAWSPLSGLKLDAGATVNASRVLDTLPTLPAAPGSTTKQGFVEPTSAAEVARILAGRMMQVPNVAEFSGRLGMEYAAELPTGHPVRASGWLRYVGSSRLGVGPVLGERQGDYLDSGATVRLGIGSLGASLGITNIFDVIGNRFALGTPFATGRNQITPLRPRTIRIGVDAAF